MPVFQDWAVRAAARPADATDAGPSAASGPLSSADDGAPPPEPVFTDLPEDASVTPAGAEIAAAAAAVTGMTPGIASPPTFATTDWQSEADEPQQLAAFDAPISDADAGHFESAPRRRGTCDPRGPSADAGRSGADARSPGRAATGAATDTAGCQRQSRVHGRRRRRGRRAVSARIPRRPLATPDRQHHPVTRGPAAARSGPVNRDEIVPSWEIDGRYGAEAPDEPGGNRLDTVLTAIAVLAILAIGIAAVLFLPRSAQPQCPDAHPGCVVRLPSTQPTALPSGLPTIVRRARQRLARASRRQLPQAPVPWAVRARTRSSRAIRWPRSPTSSA